MSLSVQPFITVMNITVDHWPKTAQDSSMAAQTASSWTQWLPSMPSHRFPA